jgi:hypothetical protein
MSSHEIFMNVYANDRRAARLREAQAHRQSQASRRPIQLTVAWSKASRFLYQSVWSIFAYRKSGASYHTS